MHVGKTLFAQLMDFLPWTTFTRIVTRYGGMFDRDTIARLLKQNDDGVRDHSAAIWALMMFSGFLSSVHAASAGPDASTARPGPAPIAAAGAS